MWKALAAIVLSTLPLRGCDDLSMLEKGVLNELQHRAESIFQVLKENCAAANAEDVDRYMRTFHPDCPDYAARRFSFEYICTEADLMSRIVRMQIISMGSEETHVLYVTRTEKMCGPSSIEDNLVATELVTLRRSGKEWHVYSAEPIQEGYFSLPR